MHNQPHRISAWHDMLLPPRKERAALLGQGLHLLDQVVDTAPDRPQQPTLTEDSIQTLIDGLDLEEGQPYDKVLEQSVMLLRDGIAHPSHPRCFGIFTPAPAFPAVIASMITSTLNPQLSSWSSAPAAQFIERRLVRFLGNLLGFPESAVDGHFTSGGTQANHTALILALDRVDASFRERGVRALAGPPRLYLSDEGHHAWFKLAQATGLGQDAVRLVPVDRDGRMNVAELDLLVSADRAEGGLPVMLVGTAGTTGTGAIDPLPQLAEAARRHGMLFHVDAAWAGAAILSRRLRPLLEGVELADSVTIDPHKWLCMPLGSGMFLNRDSAALHRAFHSQGSYQPPETVFPDPHGHSLQGSRRFVGLDFLLTLATLGRRGYEAMLDEQADLGMRLRDQLSRAGWRIVNNTLLPVICFVDPAGRDSDILVQRVLGRGDTFISATTFLGQRVMRAAITSHRTDVADIDALVETLESARRAEPGPMPAGPPHSEAL